MSDFNFDPDGMFAETRLDSLLPIGNHLTTIAEIDPNQNTSTGKPKLVVRTENAQGAITNWIAISEKTFGKFTNLVLAAGLADPQDQSTWPQPGRDFDASNGRPTDAFCAKLLGRPVGTKVIEEDDDRKPIVDPQTGMPTGEFQKRRVVAGYFPVSALTGRQSDVTQPTDQGQFVPQPVAAAGRIDDDDIPF
jgi:hypothetical protein